MDGRSTPCTIAVAKAKWNKRVSREEIERKRDERNDVK